MVNQNYQLLMLQKWKHSRFFIQAAYAFCQDVRECQLEQLASVIIRPATTLKGEGSSKTKSSDKKLVNHPLLSLLNVYLTKIVYRD